MLGLTFGRTKPFGRTLGLRLGRQQLFGRTLGGGETHSEIANQLFSMRQVLRGASKLLEVESGYSSVRGLMDACVISPGAEYLLRSGSCAQQQQQILTQYHNYSHQRHR